MPIFLLLCAYVTVYLLLLLYTLGALMYLETKTHNLSSP